VSALVRSQQGTVELSVAAYEAPGGAAYHFIMVSQPGANAALAELFGIVPPAAGGGNSKLAAAPDPGGESRARVTASGRWRHELPVKTRSTSS
jgi:hypothetical protein